MGLCLQRQKKKKHTKIRVGLEQRIVFTTVKKNTQKWGSEDVCPDKNSEKMWCE